MTKQDLLVRWLVKDNLVTSERVLSLRAIFGALGLDVELFLNIRSGQNTDAAATFARSDLSRGAWRRNIVNSVLLLDL